MKKVFLLFLALPALLAAATAAAAPAPQGGASVNERFFVGFDRTPGAAERALVASHGGRITADFAEIGALAVELSPASVGALAREGGVAYVEADPKREALGLSTTQATPSLDNGLYGLITTKSVDAHNLGYSGSNKLACVADTGLDYTHGDIATNYVAGIDTISKDSDPWWNNDVNETHGTHVAGTVLGVNNGNGVYGVAYSSKMYYARVLGPDGGTASTVMDGVRWLVETAKCNVVNLSLGGGFKSKTEERFYSDMDAKGALIVAAAGNDGQTKISCPACYASVVSVSAVDVNNRIADFSNRGRGLDIAGPGVMVLSSVPIGTGSEASVSADKTYRAFGMEYAGKTSGLTASIIDSGTCNTTGEIAATVSGNIALCQRGTESFATKVENAMSKGAAAVIIYNNTAGDFSGTLGSATTSGGQAWVPAVSVSDTTGASLKAQNGSTGTVVNQTSDWDHYSGTSMATPHVSGAAAVVWSAFPTASDDTIEDLLKKYATDLGASGYDTTYGYGLVNTHRSITQTP